MDLLERFARGDEEAFESLFREFQGNVYGWIVRLVRDPTTAEELTVEAFWRMYRARARYDPSRPFGAWARRIAMNVALSYLRTHQSELSRRVLQPVEELRATASNTVEDQELQEQMADAFARLPTRLKTAATLTLIEELPHSDVADALGISVGAVKSRVFRAIRLLRKHLRRVGIEP